MFIINFLHTYNPQPILVKIGWLQIHWYGFLIALGALLGFLVVLYLAKQYGLAKDEIYNLTFYLIIFGLIGDRLYYVFYAWPYYSHNLLDIFKIWQGGLAIHGAMIAGVLVLYFYTKKHKLNFWQLLDIFVLALALAMVFGRFGNYFNQELFGRPTNLPWGIPIMPEKRPAEFATFSFFQPTFLYESLWDLLIFVTLFISHKVRLHLNKKNPSLKPDYGYIALSYFILYSLGRFANEFLRTDYSPYFFSLRWAQFVSLLIILICLILTAIKVIKRFKTKPAG